MKISNSFFSIFLLLFLLIICCHLGIKEASSEDKYPVSAISLWAGGYYPGDTIFQRVYPVDKEMAVMLELSRNLSRQREITLGLGLSYFKGLTFNQDGSRNTDQSRLILVPGYVQFCYLFSYHQDQRFVPYLGAGLDAWGYQERTDEDKFTGCQYGYHASAGIRFLMDWLEPKAAASLQRDYHIENTYLVLEARYNQIDHFGQDKLDFSGPIYRIGVLLAF